MNKYLLYFHDKNSFHAGSKATEDCRIILEDRGYKTFPLTDEDSSKGKLLKYFQLLKLLKIEKDSFIVIQHPQPIRGMGLKIIRMCKMIRKSRVITIVHDIESLRQLFGEDRYQEVDDRVFELSDILIVHNQNMRDYLISVRHVCEDKIIVLGLFDYLMQKNDCKSVAFDKNKGIAIAGNLSSEKSGYLYKLREKALNLRFFLYGVNYEKEEKADINWVYRGAFLPDELPGKLEGSFGLVWDGKEVTTCAGTTGNYMKYNNPHKVSLYIAVELPVIIWKEAALAQLVEKEKIGITIEQLSQIPERIERITDSEYAEMKENIRRLAKEVRNGHYMRLAIERAENKLANLS